MINYHGIEISWDIARNCYSFTFSANGRQERHGAPTAPAAMRLVEQLQARAAAENKATEAGETCQGWCHNPNWGQPDEPLLLNCRRLARWRMEITFASTPPVTKTVQLCEAHAAEKRREADHKTITITKEETI